jgi:hypothetical protein
MVVVFATICVPLLVIVVGCMMVVFDGICVPLAVIVDGCIVVVLASVFVSLVLSVVDIGKLLVVDINDCMLEVVSVDSENVVDVDVVCRLVVVLVIVERVLVVVVGNGEGFCGSKYSFCEFRIFSIHCQ